MENRQILIISFKSQTRTFSRGLVTEVGDALDSPLSTHHTLAHMHTHTLRRVRGWEASLLTEGWLLSTRQALHLGELPATGATSPPRVWDCMASPRSPVCEISILFSLQHCFPYGFLNNEGKQKSPSLCLSGEGTEELKECTILG